jgi:hypothetical protein
MQPRLRELATFDRRYGMLSVLSSCVLLEDGGGVVAQDSQAPRELPPIQVTGGEAARPKRKPLLRQAKKPAPANRNVAVRPAATTASDARSVASGAKAQPSMASSR